MKLSRRAFVSGLVAAITGATIAPGLIKPATKPAPRGSISFASLHEAYMNCCYGKDFPDLMLVSPATYGEILRLLHIRHRFMQVNESTGIRGLAFNGATLGVSREMKDNQVWVQNTRYSLLNDKMNGFFELVEKQQ